MQQVKFTSPNGFEIVEVVQMSEDGVWFNHPTVQFLDTDDFELFVEQGDIIVLGE
jgi:hypothetical protein